MMRDMKRESAVDYWVRDERGLLKKLSEYADTLNNIQKALGEYLERQRAAFPRFYFVGDEDLLEIIGNAKNPIKVLRHLPKMFAGIESLEFNEEKTKIISNRLFLFFFFFCILSSSLWRFLTNIFHIEYVTGSIAMLSKEGEQVTLKEPIEVAKHESVHGWLGNLEYQMRLTLASLLHDAVIDFTELAKLGTKDAAFEKGFFKWVDTFPAQIVLLASQVNWSETVDAGLGKGNKGQEMQACIKRTEETLQLLADHILHAGLRPDLRKKYEQVSSPDTVSHMTHFRHN
jgi:dynein heavy chain 1